MIGDDLMQRIFALKPIIHLNEDEVCRYTGVDDIGGAAAALYDRIAGVAAQGEAVSITNVIELVDRAISKSNKFFRKLSGKKRYDENNCIILHEKDFR